MNFFQQQHRARRNTTLLVVYFLLAVILIVLAINALAYALLQYTGAGVPLQAGETGQPLWFWISAATLSMIGGGSLFRLLTLSGGGEAVAEMVGARAVDTDSRDTQERRLLNIVEEMSIASGTPVPGLYIMDDEAGINAFVAGHGPGEAVLVVTRGALEQLDRDELQGVVGHEYSHILNGDMRLNLRLIAILAGILLLGQLGGFMLRSLRYARGSRSSKNGQGTLIILGLGLGLFVVGYIGLFFGRLIKAAISRQREFLADASSVQFTRNPDGIAGALWRIHQSHDGSLLQNAHAEDTSHMCFGQSLNFALGGLMATHPPLEARIRAIDPGFLARHAGEHIQARRTETDTAGPVPGDTAMGFSSGMDTVIPIDAHQITASIGNPEARHLDFARELHGRLRAQLDGELLAILHRPAEAPLAIYAMLLAWSDSEARDRAEELLAGDLDRQQTGQTMKLQEIMARLPAQARLPLLDLSLPALKQLPREMRYQVLKTCETLIRADRRFSLFEFVLLTLLQRHLIKTRGDTGKVKYFSYTPLQADIRLLLSVVARAGASDTVQARQAYMRAIAGFDIEEDMLDVKRCRAGALSRALGRLAQLSPLLKPALIEACADCVLHDGRILPVEAELMRAVSATLDCPMPPLLP